MKGQRYKGRGAADTARPFVRVYRGTEEQVRCGEAAREGCGVREP
ncbi:hypothetical protein ES332_A08G124600v1 [Gossypium tomentosum]|uniref:Uncharacterized protein n=1 Tax=Gossypium tomentosum TaxID=34277 RepID=A0A5D2PEC4_GOSTO|nr:hypothetical protein ES332_A08G124600v1 [Gossypium tomentosum]